MSPLNSRIPFVFSLVFLMGFISCSKEKIEGCMDREAINYNPKAEIDRGLCEYEVLPAPSVKDLLCTQSWFLVDLENTDTLTQVTTNVYVAVSDCEKDNALAFYHNFTATKNTGNLKCLTSEPQVENGIWSFGVDETEISVELPFSGTTDYKILTLDATTLILTSKVGSIESKSVMRHSL